MCEGFQYSWKICELNCKITVLILCLASLKHLVHKHVVSSSVNAILFFISI